MAREHRIIVVSDIHYAAAAEQARGDDYEIRLVRNRVGRWLLRMHRQHVWLRNPLRQNHLVDQFLARVNEGMSLLVSNGDHTCDSGFSGVSDDAAFDSVRECTDKLRSACGGGLAVVWGDHDLGKHSMVGRVGGMRLESARRLALELGLPPFWKRQFGSFVLMGMASSLVAFDAFSAEALPEEADAWHALKDEHAGLIRTAFRELKSDQRVVLFCHDPTALPFLLNFEEIKSRIGQVACTVVGHLHSSFILKQARWLAGMPEIRFLGHTGRKLSRALRNARLWEPFNVVLCPALAGVELFKDGGYGELTLREDPSPSIHFKVHRLPR